VYTNARACTLSPRCIKQCIKSRPRIMRENDLVMAAFYLFFPALNPKNNIKLKFYFFPNVIIMDTWMNLSRLYNGADEIKICIFSFSFSPFHMHIYYLYIFKYWSLEILKIRPFPHTIVTWFISAHIYSDRFNRAQRRISTHSTLGVMCTCA